MTWPVIHRMRLIHTKKRRAALRLFAVAVALIALLPLARPVHAALPPVDGCFVNGSGSTCVYQPADLLNLSQGLYAATDAQRQSLQNLETTAVSNTLTDHGLPATDRTAVESWGRSYAEAELFGLIKGAIAAPASSRTVDQQNVVDWIAAIEQREAVPAAQDAGTEYVKWAGLDQNTYQNLVRGEAGLSDFQTFLSQPPEGALNNGGFCSYQAPAPYTTEYNLVNTAALCASNTGGGLGCNFSCVPPTPSYDQFVKWGEADESNARLSSVQTELDAGNIAAGLLFGGVAVAGVATTTGLASALVGSALQAAIFPYAAKGAYAADATAESVAAATAETAATAASKIAGSIGFIVGVVIFAITTAVIEGITVSNDAALPGKLASLIVNARTTTPDPATLLNDTNGESSLFSIFVGATLPQPGSGNCAGCFNPSAIPQPAFSDPYFIDRDIPISGTQVGSSSYTQTYTGPSTNTTTNSITVADYTRGVTETVRLSGNWFIIQPDGASAPLQSLSLSYTDWDGRQQVAWIVGNLTSGYQFVGYNATDGQRHALDPTTCLADHICWTAPSLNYIGVDGNLHGASVQTPSATTATVSYHDAFYNQQFTAYDGDPTIFAVTNPVPGVDYTWEFEQTPPCPGAAFGCLTLNTAIASAPDYTTPLDDLSGALSESGAVAYKWQTSGQYKVRLTAIDRLNRSTSSVFTVNVIDQGPSIDEDVFPQGYYAGTPFYPGMIYGQIKHWGKNDDEIVTLNWGDGTTDTAAIGPDFVGSIGSSVGVGAPGTTPDLKLTANNTGNYPIVNYAYSGPHTYARGGVYNVTLSVLDQGGLTARQTQQVTIFNPSPAVSSLTPVTATIGSAPTLTINGAGFNPSSIVKLNGVPLATTYISATTLQAHVPTTATTGLAAGAITVVNPAPGGGTSTSQILYIVPAQTTITAANLAASTDSNGDAVAVVGGSGAGTAGSVSVDGSGAGVVALAQLSSNPAPTPLPTGENAYFDVVVPAGGAFNSVKVTDCNLSGGSVLYYYDSTAAQWTKASGQTYDATTGCTTVTLGAGRAPDPSQAGGVLFDVRNAPPVVTDPGPQSVQYGSPATITVSATNAEPTDKLTLRASGLPAGLSFTDNGDGSGTISGTVTAAVGPYTATFTANDGQSDSPPVVVAFAVRPAPLTITANDKSMTYGGPVPAFDARVDSLVNGDSRSVISGLTCGATDGQSSPVSASTPAGQYAITCGGSASNYSVTAVPGTLTIARAHTSITVTSAPTSTVFGQPATFTAAIAVQSPGSGHPDGTVEFKDGGVDIAGCSARPVDTTTGTASCTTSALSVAAHGIGASYSGDANFVGSATTTALTQTVTRDAVVVTLRPSANPATFGQTVTFMATVAAAAPGAGTPAGRVTLTDGTTTLASGSVSTSGGVTTFTFTTRGLGVGMHPLTAADSGDGNFLGGVSPTLVQYINTDLSGYPRLSGGAYNLSNANLTGGYFVSAPLAGASLSGSNFTSAVFHGANLTGAGLTNSNFTGADFSNATLQNANLSNSNLKRANLTGVIWNQTTCPDGSNSSKDGGSCSGHL